MNKELIQQLLDRACYDEQDRQELEDWCNVEKFAESLIQECVKSCEQVAADADVMAKSDFVTDAGRMLHQGAWGGAMNCSAEIKKLLVNDHERN